MPKKPSANPSEPLSPDLAAARPPDARPANRRSKHHAIEEVRAERNRAEALRLRASGCSEREIANRLGVSPSTSHAYIVDALHELGTCTAATRDQLRQIEGERLEIAVRAVMVYLGADAPEIRSEAEDANGNLRVVTIERYAATMKAADTLVKLSARLSGLWGLDAPAKVEQSGPGGGPMQVQHTFTPERQAELASRARALLEAMPRASENGTANGQN